MRALFVDTGGWAMLADGKDPRNRAARQVRDDWFATRGVLVSSDYVLDETLTLMRARFGLRVARAWWEWAEQSPRILWEGVDPERAARARSWFFDWDDKDFSFTDCTSFVLMKELRIRKALATDGHFIQAGFEIVPS